jgi:NADH:ubiquinone oxidoreductase subunit 3 (subunit A)
VFDLIVVAVLAVVVFVVLLLYYLAGFFGRTTHGEGPKYEAFSGGEEIPPARGKYHSELFVYAALFVVFEVVTLLVAGSLRLHSYLWPLSFVVAGGISLTVVMLWFIGTGGAELA